MKRKKQLKVPEAYGCSIAHTPPTRRAPGKERKTRETKSGARPGRAVSPAQSAEPQREEAPFCQKRSGKQCEEQRGK